MKFFIKDSVTFTEEILNGKFHCLCSEGEKSNIKQLLHASGYGIGWGTSSKSKG